MLCVVLAAGCVVGLIVGSTGRLAPAIFAVMFTALAIYAWRAGLHPSLALRRGDLVIVNPIRTRQIAVHDIVGVIPSYSGLVISHSDQGTVRFAKAWAVQKANLSVWTSDELELTRWQPRSFLLRDVLRNARSCRDRPAR